MRSWERSSADGHARCKRFADGKVEGGTMCQYDLCHATGCRRVALQSCTNGGGREVFRKTAPENYNLGTLQNFTKMYSMWMVTHTWNVLCVTEITVRIYFVQAWGWRVFEYTSALLSAEELPKSQKSLENPVESSTGPVSVILNQSQAHYFSNLH